MKLGAVQRDVGRLLKVEQPITPVMLAEQLGIYAGIDTGYYAATLVRLAEHHIAAQVNDSWGYVRGPNWHAAAQQYRWEKE